jgi:predicted dehydrogenase
MLSDDLKYSSDICNQLCGWGLALTKIGIGVVGGGYMGKAHSVAMGAVAAVFDTKLRPSLEVICTTTESGAAEKARSFGFARSTADWRVLVNDPGVEAVVIASPQETHREIALAAFALKKSVFCEKPLGVGLADSRMMVEAAENSGCVHMTGFNYIRTPASQLAREITSSGEIGAITYFRGEHTEDFFADPQLPASWRTKGRANGNMGDLSPHIINAAFALAGPINSLIADIETVHKTRPSPTGPETVTNDDHAQIMCRFENGAMGSLYISRIATGRKMGYVYEIFGTKGAIRFDQEDQNALWLYKGDAKPDRQGFTKVLTGPLHPDYLPFCQGPGHGTGYQDQIIIEARDFLEAIANKLSKWPTFRDGMLVNQVIEAAWASSEERRWISVRDM